MIDRIIPIVGIALLAAIGAMAVMNVVSDPLAAKRAWLENELAKVPVQQQEANAAEQQETSFRERILSRPELWGALVPLPPPPPPPPPKPPEPPNMEEMLGKVFAGRAQIGKRIKFITADNPAGEFLGVGDTLNGCEITDFDRGTVTFSYYWEEGGKELTYTIQRQSM